MSQNPDTPSTDGRQLRPGQRTEVWVVDVADGSAWLAYATRSLLLEAPNWSPDGTALLLNGGGLLWRLELEPTVELARVNVAELPPINNDHVVDGDRDLIFLSADDGQIYRATINGGTATRVTRDSTRRHYLHGVSPDGKTLAFVELPGDDDSAAGRLALIASIGGDTRYPAAGGQHIDGPEYSPDGAWIYLNTEEFGVRPGHAQLARLPAGGGRLERLLASDTVDWFPHLSPNGELASYVSFPTGTVGHPADLDVTVHLVRTSDWASPLATFPVFGGQGTINVNSWSPDSRRFAFVAYPIDD